MNASKIIMEKSIEQLIYEETEQRLKEMAAPGYMFPEKANKTDAFCIIIAVVVCLIMVILCMMGVIV